MDTREGRIIILSMALGATLGGLGVWFMRMRSARGEQESIKAVANNLSWPEVFSIAIATLTLGRRIAALSEPSAESTSHKK